MPSSSAAIGALLRVTRAHTRATIGALRPANAGATKVHQAGDLVVDPVTGHTGKVLHATTTHVHPQSPRQ